MWVTETARSGWTRLAMVLLFMAFIPTVLYSFQSRWHSKRLLLLPDVENSGEGSSYKREGQEEV